MQPIPTSDRRDGGVKRLAHARILMYSHDTFGLGHLRRCRTIAHALVEAFKGLVVLIVSGSPIAGAFDFRTRVDFVKVPSVIKLQSGEYTSLDQHTDLADTLAMRRAIIRHTADSFAPDMFIVDKEPLGLRGELEETLQALKAHGTTLVLGLREVMDAPELLRAQWAERNVLRKMAEFYDEIWAYGPEDFWNPLAGLDAAPALLARTHFTGYLRQHVPATADPAPRSFREPYILVTAGGGGDGAELMEGVLAAYAAAPDLPHPVVLVLGPFMPAEARSRIRTRAAALDRASVIDFESRLEPLIRDAVGLVAMGGYNTFCELLSFDKRAILVPRTAPRREQLIRARRAAELGLAGVFEPEAVRDPQVMAQALRALPHQPLPSARGAARMLGGLDEVIRLAERHLVRITHPYLTLVEGGG
jgi:predicted glycosyltransferase